DARSGGAGRADGRRGRPLRGAAEVGRSARGVCGVRRKACAQLRASGRMMAEPAPPALAGKTLFITGASRGIGLAIGLRAARDGANIVIAAKTAEPHKKLPGTIYSAAEDVEKAGGQALPLVVDVREPDSVNAAVEAAVAKFGGIDICINNASAIQLTGT